MTTPPVPPVIPKVDPAVRVNAASGRPGRRPLPIPELATGAPGAADIAYALSAVDKNGRLADRSIVRVLGWVPGTRLDIHEQAGVITARPAVDGVHCIDGRGHLRLPLTVRRWSRLAPGDRLLVAADPAQKVLVGYLLAVLDRLLAQAQAATGRDAA